MVIEWQVMVIGFGSEDALVAVMAERPFCADQRWATYWFPSCTQAEAAAALLTLAGWSAKVTRYELDVE